MPEDPAGVVLPGGYTNAGQIVRIGDTVRRPRRATSPATHAVLEHLERVGFPGAPRLLGIDERDREVLAYVAGEVPIDPVPAWALTDAALISVAELLRGLHDALASFDPRGHAWPVAVPQAFRGGLVTHNDPNLDNVVFRGERAIALIDFDLAGPGSVVWDVACAARLWAPLRDDAHVPEPLRGRSLERLRLFVDAYGLPAAERARVADAVLLAHDWAYRIVRDAVAQGHETFVRVWREGGEARAAHARRWLELHAGAMRAALGGRSAVRLP